MEVNGKFYSFWGQIVKQKEDWIGGTLHESGDSMDRALGFGELTTEIVDIELCPNGEDSAYFEVEGKDFSCGFGVEYGGVVAGEKDWLTFSGYLGHTWRIKQPENDEKE
jgi:hypothetical protein